MKDEIGKSNPAILRLEGSRNRQIGSLGFRASKYAVANPPPISYASCHEDDFESSLVVARRDIGGQQSVML